MTATLPDSGFESSLKQFSVYPQIKSVMRTRLLTGLGLHCSATKGGGLPSRFAYCPPAKTRPNPTEKNVLGEVARGARRGDPTEQPPITHQF